MKTLLKVRCVLLVKLKLLQTKLVDVLGSVRIILQQMTHKKICKIHR